MGGGGGGGEGGGGRWSGLGLGDFEGAHHTYKGVKIC